MWSQVLLVLLRCLRNEKHLEGEGGPGLLGFLLVTLECRMRISTWPRRVDHSCVGQSIFRFDLLDRAELHIYITSRYKHIQLYASHPQIQAILISVTSSSTDSSRSSPAIPHTRAHTSRLTSRRQPQGITHLSAAHHPNHSIQQDNAS